MNSVSALPASSVRLLRSFPAPQQVQMPFRVWGYVRFSAGEIIKKLQSLQVLML